MVAAAPGLATTISIHAHLVYRDHAHCGAMFTNARFEKARESRTTADSRDIARLLSQGTLHEG
jgi:hypothetical protein